MLVDVPNLPLLLGELRGPSCAQPLHCPSLSLPLWASFYFLCRFLKLFLSLESSLFLLILTLSLSRMGVLLLARHLTWESYFSTLKSTLFPKS